MGIRSLSLFDGFFAVCLSTVGLAGFANGIGYGEWRDSAYHRGGSAESGVTVPTTEEGAPKVT